MHAHIHTHTNSIGKITIEALQKNKGRVQFELSFDSQTQKQKWLDNYTGTMEEITESLKRQYEANKAIEKLSAEEQEKKRIRLDLSIIEKKKEFANCVNNYVQTDKKLQQLEKAYKQHEDQLKNLKENIAKGISYFYPQF